MEIRILPAYTGLDGYFSALSQGISEQDAWQAHMIDPFWDTLCCYAPFSLDERKPAPIPDTPALRRQAARLRALSLPALQARLDEIAAALPKDDEDPLFVALYPADAADQTVSERQNGVAGTALFGNMLLRIDPLAEDFAPWIGYVFAHEYHHSAWGHYHYVLHPGDTEPDLLTALIIDGEADCFARGFYPALRPQWLFGLTRSEIDALWQTRYAPILHSTDFDYEACMFGSADADIPWCAGYALAHAMVGDFLARNPGVDMPALLTLPPREILRGSGWKTA